MTRVSGLSGPDELGTLQNMLRRELGVPVLVFKDYSNLSQDPLRVVFTIRGTERHIVVLESFKTANEYVAAIKTAYLKTHPEDFL